MKISLGCIVEGQGDQLAIPILIRRIATIVDPSLFVHIPILARVKRNKIVKPEELEQSINHVSNKLGGKGGILILVDSDDDCPAELGPTLLEEAKRIRSDMPISVVLAKFEFEAWFLAAAESLRGINGLPEDLEPPADPESIRGAKGWLSRHMTEGRYSETADQAALTAVFDLDLARRADSFDKCYREITDLLTILAVQ